MQSCSLLKDNKHLTKYEELHPPSPCIPTIWRNHWSISVIQCCQQWRWGGRGESRAGEVRSLPAPTQEWFLSALVTYFSIKLHPPSPTPTKKKQLFKVIIHNTNYLQRFNLIPSLASPLPHPNLFNVMIRVIINIRTHTYAFQLIYQTTYLTIIFTEILFFKVIEEFVTSPFSFPILEAPWKASQTQTSGSGSSFSSTSPRSSRNFFSSSKYSSQRVLILLSTSSVLGSGGCAIFGSEEKTKNKGKQKKKSLTL